MPMPVFLHRHGNGGQGDHVSVRVTLAGGRTTYSALSPMAVRCTTTGSLPWGTEASNCGVREPGW